MRDAAARGSTVPAHTLAELSWIQREIGIELHTTNSFVRRQAVTQVAKEPHSAAPPSLNIVIVCEHLSVNKNPIQSGDRQRGLLLVAWVLPVGSLSTIRSASSSGMVLGTTCLARQRTERRLQEADALDMRAPWAQR